MDYVLLCHNVCHSFVCTLLNILGLKLLQWITVSQFVILTEPNTVLQPLWMCECRGLFYKRNHNGICLAVLGITLIQLSSHCDLIMYPDFCVTNRLMPVSIFSTASGISLVCAESAVTLIWCAGTVKIWENYVDCDFFFSLSPCLLRSLPPLLSGKRIMKGFFSVFYRYKI